MTLPKAKASPRSTSIRGGLFCLVMPVVVSMSGCGYSYLLAGYTCADPDEGNLDADGRLDPCHRNDSDAGADAGEPCQCVPIAPNGWTDPVLVWIGPLADAPKKCPDSIPAQLQDGIDLVAPALSCGICACDPPVGSCTLPEILSTSSASCPGNAAGASHIFFNAPPGWDGSCTATDAIPACGGGPCVASLTISPLNLTQGLCTPVVLSPPAPPIMPAWSNVAVSCKTKATTTTCDSPGEICAPAARTDFARCISYPADSPCPTAGPYTDRHLVYRGWSDGRACTPCACEPAVGNSCTSSISVFKDNACNLPLPLTVPISSNGPTCVDIQPPGLALGSKSAGPVIYTPGSCQPSGGKAIGSAEGTVPTTFCCLPKP